MQVKVTKEKNEEQRKELLNYFSKKYGTISSLTQKVSISKCSSMDGMTDLVLWSNLRDGAEYTEEIIFESGDIFDTLTPRRMELMEYLSKHEADSIKQLSETLHRNYKNIYDDLHALMLYDLVELRPSGRSAKPACSVKKIEIHFGE